MTKTTSRFAVAAAAGLFMGGFALTPAQAADFGGGDCCADLEERVAELEATTVRKGNRKMSVKLSGHVNRALLFWDDGDESNVYTVDTDMSSTRFRFTGDATWKPGWQIGFRLEWEQQDPSSNNVNALSMGERSEFNLRQAHWWVKSDRLGKLSLGHLSTASDGTSEVNLSGAKSAGGALLNLLWGGFHLVNNQTAPSPTGNRSPITWGNMNPGDLDGQSRKDGVRYDTPTFGGFTLSAGWYEDDVYDVALRFAKQWNSVLFAAAVAYSVDKEGGGFCSSTSSPVNGFNGGGSPADCTQLNGSASVLHQPTGLFATIAAGQVEDDNRSALASGLVASGASVDDEANFLYANAGVKRRFNQHGQTSIGVEYYESECGFGSCGNRASTAAGINAAGLNSAQSVFNVGATDVIAGTETETWGAFIVQDIDAAATEFYLSYHHTEGSINWADTNLNSVSSDGFEDFDAVLAGAKVRF